METLKAAEVLVKKGFKVMVYTTDDPIIAKELENMGMRVRHASWFGNWIKERNN